MVPPEEIGKIGCFTVFFGLKWPIFSRKIGKFLPNFIPPSYQTTTPNFFGVFYNGILTTETGVNTLLQASLNPLY